VLRTRHDGSRVLPEEPLEPLDRIGVEVIRRLVEQAQVWVRIVGLSASGGRLGDTRAGVKDQRKPGSDG
jgi:hypothetical protein